MSRFIRLTLLSLHFCLSISSPAQVAKGKTLPTFAFNKTAHRLTNLNGSSENTNIQCGSTFGVNPGLGDCLTAYSYLYPGYDQETFGDRHLPGLPTTAVALPYALFGDRAECFIQIINAGNGPTASASRNQIRTVVNTLILQCVAEIPSTGGVAYNIGGDNNVGVILGGYHPRAVCGRSFPESESCEYALADMLATPDPKIFGPEGAPGVEVTLPAHITSEDETCLLKIYSTGNPDTTSWYRIWEAAEATYAVCGKKGFTGYFRDLGQNGDVFISLTSLAVGYRGVTVNGTAGRGWVRGGEMGGGGGVGVG